MDVDDPTGAAAAVHLPPRRSRPLQALTVRLGFALALILVVVAAVYGDRDGYRDVNGDGLTLIDAFYYAVVSLSTTGYGDITPATAAARTVNVLLVTPARVLFLIILVGTTLEILTEQYRRGLRVNRWRRTVKDHVIICGYGTKGRSAVTALQENGTPIDKIVVVERDPARVREAAAAGLAAIEGSGTRSAILVEANIHLAKTLMIATDRDDAAVLVALTARQLTAGKVRIVAAVREAENAPLLRQSGAHHVIVSSATAGRLLGLSSSAPPLLDVVEDLLAPGHGISLAMRSATREEVGRPPRSLAEVVIAVIRRGQVLGLDDSRAGKVESGDQLAYVRHVTPGREPAGRS
ncbi:NAD-binding protein of Kef-type K+ transporter [Pilimelia terevasa]|uniref:NAD-binding protein of Kef-type K+ transporter n=1 Tax=Pilimelia terevasa TaxID=53372 RepID=A0A8J3BSB4_9ACTN|nr:potassium channel family protein [Pilimelia terevasa]GGK43936.1 NAD-binding protein of Kef-type K+ transporter [Pilimelia terevasa]